MPKDHRFRWLLSIVLLLFSVLLSAGDLKKSVLSGYCFPYNKQGLADRNPNLLNARRYERFQDDLDLGVQKFNYYWKTAEDSIPSSSTPLNCQQGYTLFPKDIAEKSLLGMHKYHCYRKRFITKWKKIFKNNADYGMQIAVVLWTAPKQYIDSGCEGFYFPLQKRHLREGCVPKSQYYDDYEDWVRFTAYTFGKWIDHYIVWNEADMLNWSDTSTVKHPKAKMLKHLKAEMYRSFDIYITLLKRTAIAVSALDTSCRGKTSGNKNFVYVSITGDWYSRKIKVHNKDGEIDIRWRNMNLLDYVWKHIGLKYAWSIAVHPYGPVYAKSKEMLRFSTLKELSSYQKKKIDHYKQSTQSWLEYPQSRLFASEQNVGVDNEVEKAKFICESYDVGLKMPELVAMTHNHFQDNVHSKASIPTRHAMLPASVKGDLSDARSYKTYQAYLSTTPDIWDRKSDHYCCQAYDLGCKNSSY